MEGLLSTRADADCARAPMRRVVWDDLTSEYDARFLSAFLRSSDLGLSAAFRAAERRWARDERLHFEAFRRAGELRCGFGPADWELLEERRPDFGPIAHLFEDELSIACLFAYDELATVHAYRANLVGYEGLGLGALVRGVIADEGRHYASFLDLVRARHAASLERAPAVVERIRRTEGTPYGQTFVLDHDDASVFTSDPCDRAAAALLRALGR